MSLFVKPCTNCGQSIAWLKTDQLKPDGKPKWAACEPDGVEEDDTIFDWKRHQKHWKNCTAPSAVAFREKLAREKAEKENSPSVVADSPEIEF